MKTYMGLLVELYPKLPKLRTTGCPLLRVYKLWYTYLMEQKSALEGNKLLLQETTWMNLNNNAKWKIQKFYIQHDSIYMTFQKRQNYSVGNHISSCLELGKGEETDSKGTRKLLRAYSNSLYLTYFDMTICICQNSQNRKTFIQLYT